MRDMDTTGHPGGAKWVGVIVALLLIAFGGTVLVYRASHDVDLVDHEPGARQVIVTLAD